MDTNSCNGYSFDDALQNVGGNLVYDSSTRQLRLRQDKMKRTASIESGGSKLTIDLDSGASSESTTDNNSCFVDEDDLPDLCFDDQETTKTRAHKSSFHSLLTRITLTITKENNASDANKCQDDDGELASLDSIWRDHVKRPDHLPPKDWEEERKHVAALNEMLTQAKKREEKEIKLRRRLLCVQHQQEDEVSEAIRIWCKEILPCWASSHRTKRARDLWWAGIPSPVRDKVWSLAIGNELNITKELYRICVQRSKKRIWTKQFVSRRFSHPCKPSDVNTQHTHRRHLSTTSDVVQIAQVLEDKLCLAEETDEEDKLCLAEETDEEDKHESVAFLIKLDVSRTFPQLGLFQEHGPYHEALSDILAAYAVYRPDLSYCQGMSFLAAMLLLNLDSPAGAFIAFANFLNNQLLLTFYRLNESTMRQVYELYDEQFQACLPRLWQHFSSMQFSSDLFLVDQIYTLFSRCLPFECACRVWDVFLRDGSQFFFRASLALLAMYEDVLITMDMVDIARFLSRLPEDIDTHRYFNAIANIRLTSTISLECLDPPRHKHNIDNSTIVKKLFS